MKERLAVLFLAFSSIVSATTYYVSPGGKDSNPGTIAQPWATWGKAFTSSSVNPGDTVFFRGGVYLMTVAGGDGYAVTRAGTSGNWIVYSNYPGEVPILDCSNIDPGSNHYSSGVGADTNEGANYIKFIGLTIRNVWQLHGDHEIQASAFGCTNGYFVFEKCTAYNIDGHGFNSFFVPAFPSVNGEHRFINCDAYNCSNTFAVPPALPGNAGSGFASYNFYSTEGRAYFKGCRAWKCGDQGFSISGDNYIEADNCWSFRNGLLDGDGHGFKLGWVEQPTSSIRRMVKNCIAAFNRQSGITTNDSGYDVVCKMNIYNNTVYHNGYHSGWSDYIYGIYIDNTSGSNADELTRVFRNNISYDNIYGPVNSTNALYTHDHNSWDASVTVTDADFLSVDSTGISGPRQADGSLPDLNFLRLSSTSDLIDKGINVGLPYDGTAPDIGQFEYSATGPKIKLVTGIIINAAGGASMITENKGNLQLTATVLPSDVTNKTITWSVINGTGQASISSSGVVTAVGNGTVTAKATANDGSGVSGILLITISNQIIPVERITITGAGGVATISTDGGSLQLSAAISPADASNKTVTWSITSGSSFASVNASTGVVTAIDNGTITVRATANDGSGIFGTFNMTITNQFISVVSITVTGAGGASAIFSNKGTLQLSASVLPSNAADKTVFWSVENGTGQATISSSGLVTAIANGTITARANANDGSGVYGIMLITISSQLIPITNITVTGAGGASSINTDGGSLQLTAAVFPANASNKAVTWSLTSGSGLASINASTGLVTAVNNGTVTARATAKDGSGVYGTLAITITNQVIPVSSMTVSGVGGTATITTDGGSLQLSAVISPGNATNKTVTWSITSGSSFASVNASTGIVTAIDNGTITVRAVANDGSGVYGTFRITIINQVNVSDVKDVNVPPTIVVSYKTSSYSGFVSEINASGSYDINKDNLTFTWVTPNNVSVSSKTGSSIKYLSPVVNSPQSLEFTLKISDGKSIQSKKIPVEILPYKPELEIAEISNIEASGFQAPYYPYNIFDGNIGTMWSAEGDNQWLILELKHSFSVHHVKLAFQPGQIKESYFDIMGSVDKVTWEPILTKTASCSFSGDLQVFGFPPSKTGTEFNYIKLVGRCNSTDSWNYISELKIFGTRHWSSPEYEKLPVKIYPNPAKEFITVRIDESTLIPDFIQFVDLSGIVVLRTEAEPDKREYAIPIDFKKGLYVVQLVSGSMTLFTQKLIIDR